MEPKFILARFLRVFVLKANLKVTCVKSQVSIINSDSRFTCEIAIFAISEGFYKEPKITYEMLCTCIVADNEGIEAS